MLNFKLSAFSDEYSPSLDEQIRGLVSNRVRMSEVRGIDGRNISEFTPEEAAAAYKKLYSAGISVSSIGSPIGKIKITEPNDSQVKSLENLCKIAKVMNTTRIRIFSYYIPDGKYEEYRDEVMARLGALLEVAKEHGITLCHENEKGIYGDKAERCLDIMKTFGGEIGCIFDPANFVQCGETTFEYAYRLLVPYITYMHIKDSKQNGVIVPAGMGDGHIPEILSMLARRFDGEMILTAEPHLAEFVGLDALEGDDKSIVGTARYKDNAEAFADAIKHIRMCIPSIATHN